MNFKKLAALLFILTALTTSNALACSMYKLTAQGKTMLGSNYDAYFTTAKIWFENAARPGECGAVFTGGNPEGPNGNRPQSGMNACGIAFTGAAVQDPIMAPDPNKKQIDSRAQYLKDILHQCTTLQAVHDHIAQYDRSTFPGTVFLYTDQAGDYLIVEPDKMTMGHDPKLVLSNFCPSTTSLDDARKLERYRNGLDFRHGQIDPSLDFCTGLSDTMSVCRARIGDGTLLTTIWDLQAGIVSLYFYHDFQHLVQFDLKAELAKGDHTLDIPGLFPANAEYETLLAYNTPQNSPRIRLFLLFCAGLFLFSGCYFGLRFLRGKVTGKYARLQWLLFPLGLILTYYMFVLATNLYIFYFQAPFRDPSSMVQNIAAYIPFLLLALILPLAWANVKILRDTAWPAFSKMLFALNNMTYWVLMGWFVYWGLLGIF
jgi:hypothetical protein